jgi:AraC-like DNA-binding protein
VSIATIAGLCGFEDATTFTRAFRRRYGLRPSDLRAQRGDLAEAGAG